MTLIVNNDGVGISQLVTPANTGDETASLQIRDGLDFPHSGVFKALYSAATGNYALKNGAAGSMGFNFTYAGGTSPTVAVAAGKIFRDGKYVSISALSAHALTRPTSGNFYHLVVVKADNSMDVRISTSVDDIPELTDGDIPIGLVKVAHDADTATASLPTQFFTSHKTDNNLSIGYLDSNAYTPTMDVFGDGTRTVFKNKIANADIRFILADNTADEKFEILSDDDSDGDDGDTTVFSVDGLGATSVVGTLNLGSVVNAGTDTDKFLVLDGSGNVDFRTGSEVASDIGASGATLSGSTNNTITTVTGANAIQGEANLTFDGSTLAVTGALTTTTTATVGTDLTVTGGDVGFGNGQDATISVAATTSTTAGRDLTISAGSTSTNGNNIDGGDLILKSGGGDGTGTSMMAFHTKVSGTDTAAERMRIHTDGNVGIGINAPTAPLHILSGGSGDHLLIEGTLASAATSAPNLVLFRDADSAASDIDDNDLIGQIVFRGENDGVNNSNVPQEVNYATIEAGMDDTSDDSEDGHMTFNLIEAGTLSEYIRLRAATRDVVINEQGDDIDFRCEGSSDSNLLFVDASADKIGVGLNAPKTKLTVEGAFTLKEQADADGDTAAYGQIWVHDDTPNTLYFTNDAGNDILLSEEVFIISLSDETTDLTTGNGKASFNMPFAMTLTGVKATVNTAPVGSTITVDINEAGSTILSTKLTIDASELTSSSAATAAVISDASLANDALITFDIDQIGSSTAGKGLKVTLYGYRT